MDVSLDESTFDAMQLRLAHVLVEDITRTLIDVLELDEEVLVAVGRTVSFSVAAILDGSRLVAENQSPLIPHLAFASSDERSTLITSSGGSWMHEYVHGLVSEVFGELDSPVILNDEIKRIPVRGLAVMAHRGIERGAQLLSLAHRRKLPKKHAKMVGELLVILSNVARFEGDSGKHTEVLPWGLLKDFEAPLGTLKAGSPERSLFLAAQEATRLNYRKVSGSLSFAAAVGDGQGSKWAKIERMAATANYLDFRLVQSLIQNSNCPNDPMFESTELGALWPNGEPSWADYHSRK